MVPIPGLDHAGEFLRDFWRRRQTLIGLCWLSIGALFLLGWLLAASSGPSLPDPQSRQFAVDFRDYWLAAQRMAGGASPYNPVLLNGPVGSQGLDIYRYPPVLAFLLIPLSGLDYISAGWIWVGISAAALAAGLCLALRAGGSALNAKALLWTAVAAVWFMPTLDSLWKGNVEGLQVLLIAAALTANAPARASSIVAQAWLKIAPVVALPALLVREGRRGWIWLFATSAILVVPAFLWAPAGWRQLPKVLADISGADTVVASNLAPSSWLVLFTGSDALGAPIRAGLIIAALALAVLSVYLARRPDGWAAALLAGVAASLLLPGTIWLHYLLVLLPFGAYAWPRLSARSRCALIGAGTAISAGIFSSALAFAGAVAFAGVALRALWPPRPAPTNVVLPTSLSAGL